jgi:hypothetical protein
VAEEGRRVYVVGGRVSVDLNLFAARESIAEELPAAGELTAEVYELDLGDDPLAESRGVSSAHWRQVR